MKELLRQIVEELENVHVVASSDRLFELVAEAKSRLEWEEWANECMEEACSQHIVASFLSFRH